SALPVGQAFLPVHKKYELKTFFRLSAMWCHALKKRPEGNVCPARQSESMPTRFWFRVAEFALTAILAIILAEAWRADRRDRAQLAVDLATAKQALAQADSRQHDREAQLQQSLKALDSERRNITTPAQILRE